MSFINFLSSVFFRLGDGGRLILSVFAFLVALGVYKFVKDWLPW